MILKIIINELAQIISRNWFNIIGFAYPEMINAYSSFKHRIINSISVLITELSNEKHSFRKKLVWFDYQNFGIPLLLLIRIEILSFELAKTHRIHPFTGRIDK